MNDFKGVISAIISSGRRVYAAELRDNARSVFDMDLTCNDCLVIGNEGHGIPAEISSLCNNSVYIPITESTESLNAAVAASILVWEQSK